MHHECGHYCKEYKTTDAPFAFEEINGIEYKRCPLQQVGDEVGWWVKAYSFYKNGLLPSGTSWLKETNKFIQIITLIDNEVAKILKEQSDGIAKRNGNSPKAGR